MTKDDIITMALEVRLFDDDMENYSDRLENFANLVAAAEQRRCIGIISDQRGLDYVAQRTVDAIRSQS
jgi:hypothetical protein